MSMGSSVSLSLFGTLPRPLLLHSHPSSSRYLISQSLLFSLKQTCIANTSPPPPSHTTSPRPPPTIQKARHGLRNLLRAERQRRERTPREPIFLGQRSRRSRCQRSTHRSRYRNGRSAHHNRQSSYYDAKPDYHLTPLHQHPKRSRSRRNRYPEPQHSQPQDRHKGQASHASTRD